VYARAAQIRANEESVNNTRAALQSEIDRIQTGTGPLNLNPLDLVQTGGWGLLISNLPERVADDEKLLGQVREYQRLTNQVNEMMRSRERWRHSTDQNLQHLAGYDGLIQTWLIQLANSIVQVGPQVEEVRRRVKAAGR
jgi:hypothetical protein